MLAAPSKKGKNTIIGPISHENSQESLFYNKSIQLPPLLDLGTTMRHTYALFWASFFYLGSEDGDVDRLV